MNWSEWFLATMGAVVVTCIAFMAVVCSWGYWQEKRNKTHRPSYRAGAAHTLDRLRNDAWWLSEDQTTTDLLLDWANNVDRDSMWSIRDRWRQARAAAPAATNQKEN